MGNLFDIQRNSCVDGPGIRTTVFFKGCNMRCAWCHNPESQSPESQTMIYPNRPEEVCGRLYSVEEVMRIILKDRAFYAASGGGVTLSGGECMLQTDFLTEILRACKANGIHTAVDTAGHVPYQKFERILPYTDLFLYDVKCFDNEKHKQYTGVGNAHILENLKKLLAADAPVWVRIPIIPSVNDTEEEMEKIKALLDTCKAPKKIELLPYHAMGEHKYLAIGKTPPVFSAPCEKTMTQLNHVFS